MAEQNLGSSVEAAAAPAGMGPEQPCTNQGDGLAVYCICLHHLERT